MTALTKMRLKIGAIFIGPLVAMCLAIIFLNYPLRNVGMVFGLLAVLPGYAFLDSLLDGPKTLAKWQRDGLLGVL